MKSLFLFLVLFLAGGNPLLDSVRAQDTRGVQGADVGPCIEVLPAMAFDHDGTTLMVLPDGSGPSFTSARYFTGVVVELVDTTISVRILDCSGDPWPAYPREDIWLEPNGGELVFCPAGNIADQDTDLNGETSWRSPLLAGGWSQSGVIVRIAENHLIYRTLPLQINSPDIDGDLRVTLADVALFSGDYFGDYHFRSDVAYDQTINLLDVTRMMSAWGSSCP